MVQQATDLIEALYHAEGKAEIVDGRVVEMPPAGEIHAYVAFRAAMKLQLHVDVTGIGRVVSDGAGFLVDLPNRLSFSPDAAYYIRTGPRRERMIEGAPLFAIEIRSPDDYGLAAERRLAAKRADYFAAGTLVVWDVNVRAQTVSVYRWDAPDQPTIYGIDDVAEAEPAVPGWTMAVRDLFPEEA